MKEKDARKRVKDLKGFYTHIVVYLMVNTILFVIDVVNGGDWFFYWVLLGWGIGVFINAVVVLGLDTILNPSWEEDKVKEMMKKK